MLLLDFAAKSSSAFCFALKTFSIPFGRARHCKVMMQCTEICCTIHYTALCNSIHCTEHWSEEKSSALCARCENMQQSALSDSPPSFCQIFGGGHHPHLRPRPHEIVIIVISCEGGGSYLVWKSERFMLIIISKEGVLQCVCQILREPHYPQYPQIQAEKSWVKEK